MVFFELFIHILIIHPPDALCIPFQLGMYCPASIIVQDAGKSGIRRRMNQNCLARCRKCLQRGNNTAQHAIFITDRFFCQPFNAVADLLPIDDAVVIFLGRIKISEHLMLQTLRNRFADRRRCLEIHVRHPHRNPVKPLCNLCIRHRNVFPCDGILSRSVDH